jgi:DNA-3-methyladenine glycosylase II
MHARPGLRPTLFGSPYEAAVWGVLSARISMRQAASVQARISAEHGAALEVAGELRHGFPSPAALLRIDAVPGLAAEKLRRLHGIAEGALDGQLEVNRLRALGGVGAREELRRLRGIGPFWAAGIWLRACGVVDEFPAEERACRAALARLHGRPEDADLADLADLIEQLAPYRMWSALLLRVAG